MDEKGQGSLEYLLIIGGAILVAAIVVFLLTQQTQTGKGTVESIQNQQSTGFERFENRITEIEGTLN
ncbi:MAG TPA: class III signal peptide-containing protein [archaeon]|nr:class III signal peptide-containing protein [archaeon]